MTIKSDWAWLCPICMNYFNKNNSEKKEHIKEEIEKLKLVLKTLNKELQEEEE